MWKGKYRSTNNTNEVKGKGKRFPKIEEISGGNAHTKTYMKYFDDHRCLSQSEESECTRM